MRVFVDANVMLDLLMQREPFRENAAKIFTLAKRGEITAVVASVSFATASFWQAGLAELQA